MPAEALAHPAPTRKWLSIVGIGEDGIAGLGEQARKLIAQATYVFGGERHLDLARPLIAGQAIPWPKPFDPSMAAVLRLRGSSVCVLASGDPLLHGVGTTIARVIPSDEFATLPAPSAFSLSAARQGWSLQHIDTVSLHGKSIDLLRPLLHPNRRIIALTSDSEAPAAIAALLRETGFGGSVLTVMEAMGGESERISQTTADAFPQREIDPLNVVAIEVTVDAKARVLPLTPGITDELFEHDGQITKRHIRALTLSALAPRRGELLWDVGAGSGSVSIEWMLADPSMQAIAIEADDGRAECIARNARAFGVPGLEIVSGEAPAAFAGLPTPDAIFIGGGGTEAGLLDAAIVALAAGGRLVANAVTIEMESILLAAAAQHGGELTRIAISRSDSIGTMTAFRPALPITQWAWSKP